MTDLPEGRARLVAEWRSCATSAETAWEPRSPTWPRGATELIAAGDALAAALGEAGTPPRAPDALKCKHGIALEVCGAIRRGGQCSAGGWMHSTDNAHCDPVPSSRPEVVTPDWYEPGNNAHTFNLALDAALDANGFPRDEDMGRPIRQDARTAFWDTLLANLKVVTPDATEAEREVLAAWWDGIADMWTDRLKHIRLGFPMSSGERAGFQEIYRCRKTAVLLRAPRPVSHERIEAANQIILRMHRCADPVAVGVILRDHQPRYYEPGSIVQGSEIWRLTCQCGRCIVDPAYSRAQMWEPWIAHVAELVSVSVREDRSLGPEDAARNRAATPAPEEGR